MPARLSVSITHKIVYSKFHGFMAGNKNVSVHYLHSAVVSGYQMDMYV